MYSLPVLILSLVALNVIGLGIIQNDSVETQWQLWKQEFEKSYEKSEEKIHKEIWLEHYKIYTGHRQDVNRQYELEMNEFADQLLPRKVIGHTRKSASKEGTKSKSQLRFVPSEWDWRQHDAISPVKNQGEMDDVVSIVATESVESYVAIKNGTLEALSTYETKQCCVPEPIMSADVFKCIHSIGGLCSDESYPKTSSTCQNGSCTPIGTVNDGKQSPQGDEAALKDAVYSVPVMAGIDASHVSFQLYRSGVYSEPSCRKEYIDHAVQIVGYGTMNGQDYWICKNSWGINWGMNGYVMIARNKNNMCGIATAAYYPV